MTVFELQEAIDTFHKQGFNDKQISMAFGMMYIDDKCNYQDLEIILPMLHMEIKPEFAAMTDAERKAFLKKAYNMK